MSRLLLEFSSCSTAVAGNDRRRQTIVTDIHRQVVDVHQWMTAAQFVDACDPHSAGPGSRCW